MKLFFKLLIILGKFPYVGLGFWRVTGPTYMPIQHLMK